jgi:hypothetical protein
MIVVLDATRDLLARLDPLSYRDRTAQLATWARAATDREAVCADLREQGEYQRGLALLASMVAGDRAGIEAATHDPVPGLRSAALRAALRAGLLAGRVGDLSADERRRLYRTLRRLHRPAVADAIVGEVRELRGDAEAAAVLPACGSATVRALLPALEHLVRPEALARRHPDVYLDRIAERLDAAEPEDRREIWDGHGPAILECDPVRVLPLLERYAPADRLPGGLTAYGKLAAHSPERVARLIAAPGRAAALAGRMLPPAVVRRLTGLPTELLVPLFRLVRSEAGPFAALLHAFAPARRGELYDATLADVDVTAFVPGAAVLEELPAAVRHREAARVLALPKILEREASVREWSAFLPWPEAVAALEGALRAGDAEVRASAYRRLVEAARRTRDRRVVAEVVSRLERLRNEQDPVRAAALNALTGVAPLLTDALAPALTAIVTDVVEARDASAATSGALAELAAATLQQHIASPALTDWALSTIDLIGSASRTPLLRRFDGVLRRGQEAVVVERLSDWVTAAMARGWYGPLFALTYSLGKRAWLVPPLQELLRSAIGPRTLERVARAAVELWLDDPRARSSRVAAVLAVDASTVVVPVVWRTVAASRTDLLDEVLRRPPRGRLIEAGVRWVPGPAVRAGRWLPRQQAAFVARQEVLISDQAAPVWVRAAALQAAARVGSAGRSVVLRHVGSSEVVIAEAALAALPWTDRPDEALSVLLEFADGDRARVALYAAGRAVRFVEPSRLPALLGGVLLGPARVTSRKAAARLLAAYGPPAALDTLREAYGTAHRDVRAAIVAGARLRLDREASWTILARAGRGSREEQQAVLAAGPRLVPEQHRPRYAALIAAAGRSPDREVRRAAMAQLPLWARWAPGAATLIEERLADLGERLSPMVAAQLLGALLQVPDAGPAGGTVAGLLVRLADRDAADDRPDDPVADRPARRRVGVLLAGAVILMRSPSRSRGRAAVADAIRRLAARPAFTAVAVPALVGLGRLDDLDEIADLCAGRPALAVAAAGRVGARLRELPEVVGGTLLPGLVRRLAGRGDLAGGLFAVALVRPGATFEWAAPWRDLLVALRAHPDTDVREEAYAIDMS